MRTWLVVWDGPDDEVDNTSLFTIEDEALDHARQVSGMVYLFDTQRNLTADFTDPVCSAMHRDMRCLNDKGHRNIWHVADREDNDGSHRFVLWHDGGQVSPHAWVVPITDALAAKQRRESPF